MREFFEQIETWLKRLERPVVELLRPPASQQDLAKIQKSTAVGAGDNLVLLYEWHDGTTISQEVPLKDAELLPGYFFLSVADAVQALEDQAGLGFWSDGVFPIFGNGAGDFLIRDVDGAILDHMFDDPTERRVAYGSLRGMFASIVHCFSNGVFHVEQGALKANLAEQAAVAISVGKGSAEYWAPFMR